jgi:hypothetical protein
MCFPPQYILCELAFSGEWDSAQASSRNTAVNVAEWMWQMATAMAQNA